MSPRVPHGGKGERLRLDVWTARIGFDRDDPDADALDISRGGNARRPEQDRIGLPFAPSPLILGPVLERRKAGTLTDADYSTFVSAYIEEMRASYRRARAGARGDAEAWTSLLSRERVVLTCFCSGTPLRCHRILLARILEAAGRGVYRGEIEARRRQPALFGERAS